MPTSRCSVSALLKAVSAIAPPELAEDWDNVGLQVGHPNAQVTRVMTCLELTETTLKEALRRKADAVVAHHPLIFKPLKSLNLAQPGAALVAVLIKHDIALIAAHTNLDSAAWSTNSVLAETLGLPAGDPLFPQELPEENRPVGLGQLIELESKTELPAFLELVKDKLGLDSVRVSGPQKKKVRKVAICTGSGGSFIGPVAARADVYLTGEINYHHGVEAAQRGLPVVELGHFESEVLIAEPLAKKLSLAESLAAAEVAVFPAKRDYQPFRTI